MLTKETKGLIGKTQFGMMKKSALFVNTARGEIIDGNALIGALKKGIIQGAALDVFPGEPLNEKDKSLITYARSYDDLILTPHIGASTTETVHTASLEIVKKVASEINKW
jgi:phosphoglycerate dehydrogenase-like enzyme